jgi:hypothetical protein
MTDKQQLQERMALLQRYFNELQLQIDGLHVDISNLPDDGGPLADDQVDFVTQYIVPADALPPPERGAGH